MASSRRYAEEVSNRIDRVIRSIRSTSPVLRNSYHAYEVPLAVSEIHRLDVDNRVLHNHNRALDTTNVVLHDQNRALHGHNRSLDTNNVVLASHNRALAHENEVLRDQSRVQTDLLVENSHIRTDLKKSFVENELLRRENEAIPAYRSQVNVLVKQSADLSTELNHQAREATSWKVRFDEADQSAAKYRSLYQQALQDNENFKIEIVELRKDLAHMNAVKVENNRLHDQNQALLDQIARLNRDLAIRSDENVDLRTRLREIDVLRSQLSVSEQENGRLRDTIANQNDIIVDLRKTISALHADINALKADLSIITSLETKIQVEIRNNEALGARLRDRDVTIVDLNKNIVALTAEINSLKAELSIITSLEAKLNTEIRTNEALGAKLREKDSIIVELNRSITNLTSELTQLKAELNSLDAKINVEIRSNEALGAKLREKDSIIAELNRTISALSSEVNSLKADLSIISSLESKISLEVRNNQALGDALREKDSIIADLNRTISTLNLDNANLKRDVAHLNDAVAQNSRFRAEIDRLLLEIDSLKSKLARLVEVENRLVLVSSERDALGAQLNQKLDIIRDLTSRIAHLEDQLAALEQLKAKVVLVVAENERLGQLVVDQSRTIAEWADKYDQLERLYLAVKATTHDLAIVKDNLELAVKSSEIRNPNLRNSYYRPAGKGELFNSRYSIGSAETMGSPTGPYSPNRVI